MRFDPIALINQTCKPHAIMLLLIVLTCIYIYAHNLVNIWEKQKNKQANTILPCFSGAHLSPASQGKLCIMASDYSLPKLRFIKAKNVQPAFVFASLTETVTSVPGYHIPRFPWTFILFPFKNCVGAENADFIHFFRIFRYQTVCLESWL